MISLIHELTHVVVMQLKKFKPITDIKRGIMELKGIKMIEFVIYAKSLDILLKIVKIEIIIAMIEGEIIEIIMEII